MDIEGLGDKLVSQLVNTNTIKDPADLYFMTKDQLLTVDRMAEKSVNKLLAAIERSKSPSLEKFLFALGIRHVGENMARVLARSFMALDRLIQATETDLTAIRDIGPEAAGSITRFFSEPSNIKVIEKFREAGVKLMETVHPETAILSGKSFVFTGTLTKLTRNEAKRIVESLGALTTDSIAKNTAYLVAGESPGSKLDKAKASGVTIIDEEEFLNLIGKNSLSLT